MVSTTFRELGLSAPILRQLENLEYKTPTPIQAASIPLLLRNKDLLGLAQTGSRKTAGPPGKGAYSESHPGTGRANS